MVETRCTRPAEVYLHPPGGDHPTSRLCELHARQTVEEYRAVLGQVWTTTPLPSYPPPTACEHWEDVRVRTSGAREEASDAA